MGARGVISRTTMLPVQNGKFVFTFARAPLLFRAVKCSAFVWRLLDCNRFSLEIERVVYANWRVGLRTRQKRSDRVELWEEISP